MLVPKGNAILWFYFSIYIHVKRYFSVSPSNNPFHHRDMQHTHRTHHGRFGRMFGFVDFAWLLLVQQLFQSSQDLFVSAAYLCLDGWPVEGLVVLPAFAGGQWMALGPSFLVAEWLLEASHAHWVLCPVLGKLWSKKIWSGWKTMIGNSPLKSSTWQKTSIAENPPLSPQGWPAKGLGMVETILQVQHLEPPVLVTLWAVQQQPHPGVACWRPCSMLLTCWRMTATRKVAAGMTAGDGGQLWEGKLKNFAGPTTCNSPNGLMVKASPSSSSNNGLDGSSKISWSRELWGQSWLKQIPKTQHPHPLGMTLHMMMGRPQTCQPLLKTHQAHLMGCLSKAQPL